MVEKRNKKIIDEVFVSPVLMWTIILIGIFAFFVLIPLIPLFPRTKVSVFFFALTFIFWVYFLFSAVRVHKQAPRSVAAIKKVVKEGVYGIVRHPIYLADIVFAIGVFIFYPYLHVLLSISWLIFVMAIWMLLEEKSLEDKFGKEYTEYKKEVPMILPRIIYSRNS